VFCVHIFGGVCPPVGNVLRFPPSICFPHTRQAASGCARRRSLFDGSSTKSPPDMCSVNTYSAASVRHHQRDACVIRWTIQKVTAYFVFGVHIFGGVCPAIGTPPTLCSVYTYLSASVCPSATCNDYLLCVSLTHGRQPPFYDRSKKAITPASTVGASVIRPIIQKVTANYVLSEHIFSGVCPSIVNVLRIPTSSV